MIGFGSWALENIHTIRIDDWPEDPAVRPVTYGVHVHLGEAAGLSIDSRIPTIVATGSGDDTIRTGQGNDLLVSGAGNDTLVAGSGDDTVYGDSGNDRIVSGDGADEIYGGDGNDLIAGGAGNDWISDWSGMNTLRGGAGDDLIQGSGKLFGDDGSDSLIGSETNDRLFGGAGDDFLLDDAGTNLMVGGAGADKFAFIKLGFIPDAHNTIRDFSGAGAGGEGDVIYLYGFGAPGVLQFIGNEAFGGHNGEVRYGHTGGGNTVVQVDRDGDRQSDLTIKLVGLHELQASDFEFGEPEPPIIFG